MGRVRIALALAAATALSSARGEDPTPLPPVSVPLPDEPPAPESPSRRDPSGAITVVQVDGRFSEVKEAAELLAEAPGVVAQDSGGLGQRKTVTMRGASSNGVLVLLDGVPLNGAGGIADLSLLPVALLDRFEVLRGAAGARYGAGGLGGVVNAVSRRPSAGALAEAELSYGSFDTATASLTASGPLFGGTALALVHGLRSDGDFPFLFSLRPAMPGDVPVVRVRENNAAQQGGALFKAHGGAGGFSVDGLLEGFAERRGIAGTERNPTPDGEEQGQRLSAALHASHPLGEGELSLRGYYKAERTYLEGGLHPRGLDQVLRSAGASAGATAPLWGSLLTADLDVAREALSLQGGYGPAWVKGGASAMLELPLLSGLLAVSPSLRLDGILTTAAGGFEKRAEYLLLSPKLGAVLSLPHELELRANAGQSYRAPSMLELYVAAGNLLPNPWLRPERALSADLGLWWRGEKGEAGATAYGSLYQDLIAYEYYPPFLARPFNFDAAAAGGLELEARGRPLGDAELEATYTLTLSQNLRDDPRFYLKELPYRPRHKARARASFGPEVLRAHLEADYQSAALMNRAGTLVLPERVLLGAGLSYRAFSKPRVAIGVEVKNLLDAHAEDFDGYPLPGRSLFVTLTFAKTP